MYILQVIPITKSIRTSSLSYFSTKEVRLGTMVSVPLRKKEVEAIVVHSEPVSHIKSILKNADYQLRNILKIHNTELFDVSFLKMSQEIAQYHASYTGLVIDTLTPKAILKNITSLGRIKKEEQINRNPTPEIHILQRSKKDRLNYYKTRAREVFTNKKSLCIVCPTIAESIEVFDMVSKGIEQRSHLINGTLSEKKLLTVYREITKNDQSILLVGTASCISIPLPDVIEYIIHHSSSPHYKRDIAEPLLDLTYCIERVAFHTQARCVYADTTIDISTWQRVRNNEINIIEPAQQKIFGGKLKKIRFTLGPEHQDEHSRIKELKHQAQGFHPLHIESIDAIKKAINHDKKVLVYVTKKGLAPNIVCKECGNIAISPFSKLPYSLYIQKNKETGKKEAVYICNKTKEKIRAFDQCQFCKGVSLIKMGIATSSVAEDLKKSFPNTTISILDGQHTKTKKSLKELKTQYNHQGAHIVVGTSKAINELPYWDTGVIVSLAPLMAKMGYRNEEDVIHLVTSLQEKTNDHLLLQDRKDIFDHFDVFNDGLYSTFIENELKNREQFHYPPFYTLIELTITLKKIDFKQQYAYYAQRFSYYDPSIMVRPHSAKEVLLIIIIKQPLSQWNLNYQDPQLLENLKQTERNVQIRMSS